MAKKRIRIDIEDAEGANFNLNLTGNITREKVLKALIGVRTITQVCEGGEKEIDLSLLSDIKDFEDAFQYSAWSE